MKSFDELPFPVLFITGSDDEVASSGAGKELYNTMGGEFLENIK